MKRLFQLVLVVSVCLLFACSRGAESQEAGDPNGTWVGDFGPAFYDRNTISVELHWDGNQLTGMILPGVPGGRMYRNFEGFAIENGSFNAKTGEIKFDATYKPRDRRYLIQGKVTKDSFSGTWSRPEEKKDGDFKLTKQ